MPLSPLGARVRVPLPPLQFQAITPHQRAAFLLGIEVLPFHGQTRTRYGSPTITREDIFCSVDDPLHTPDDRKALASDLKKSLPRVPLVDTMADFRAFSDAGRALAEST